MPRAVYIPTSLAVNPSLTISAVIAGIAIASLPSGRLADRVPVRRLIGIGGVMAALCCLVVAATTQFSLLVIVRFVQGLFVPALTTCWRRTSRAISMHIA